MPLLLGAVLVAGLVAALVVTRRGWRLGHPRWSERLDAAADRGVVVLIVLVAVCVALAVAGVPGGGGEGLRIVPAGLAVGFLTGIPYAAERRALRARLRTAPPPPDPLPAALDGAAAGEPPSHAQARSALRDGDAAAASTALGDLDARAATATELRLRGLAAAMSGDARATRACALRAAQLEPGAAAVRTLTACGLLLGRRGRLREAVRLLERACELDRESDPARLALVEALRRAGRLRDAVAALEGRHPPVSPAPASGPA